MPNLRERFEPDYFDRFDAATVATHLAALGRISEAEPAIVLLQQQTKGTIDCTIVAFDHPFEFSCITGILAGTGFSIDGSDAFTLPEVKSAVRPHPRRHRPQRAVPRRDPAVDAVILDHFSGRLLGPTLDFDQWAGIFRPAVLEVMQLLDRDDEPSTEHAKRLVIERVTRWLKARRQANPRTVDVVPDVEVTIKQLPGVTRLRTRAADVPAFLYALSTALSLHGLQIQKTRAQIIDGQALNEIDVVDQHGQPLKQGQGVRQLRPSVLLTEQFAYPLDRSPDPFTALRRFEELSETIVRLPRRGPWLELLANPLSMIDLAKVLGASDFLWEDFIRWQAESLLPVLRRHARGGSLYPPARSLPRRLQEALAGARDFEAERRVINQFKDRELFLIDLDHILASENPDLAFGILSERLVFLAENLVAAAATRVFAELVRLYGRPRDADGREVGYAVFGLGKLGGVALGYASDIELLFVFASAGRSSGGVRGALGNDEFFSILTREACAYVQARREGIFQVDLRLRPYGTGGPLACSKQQFCEYYGPAGDAHAFERLALVRLRWIAGDAGLGFQIEQARDELLYRGQPLDVNAIWEVSAKMRQQHLRGGPLNSKHSPGGLADLEQMVQLLQVNHAGQVPQLRTPRLHEAILSLRRAEVLSPLEFERLMAAYEFLRRLINAQRMLRGSARDLVLPPEGSDELVHLARRMNHEPEEQLLTEFSRQTKAIVQLIHRRFAEWKPGKQ